MVRKTIAHVVLLLSIFMLGTGEASAEFGVDWGESYDNGLRGYQQLSQWLVANGYYNDMGSAEIFSREGYVGYDNSGADPFTWNLSEAFNVQIVQEMAGFADLNTLGYYTGSGGSKSLTQIFSGTEFGSKTIMLEQPFGFYLGSPQQNFWYTDRAENLQQAGFPLNAGGDPQALIYELTSGSEWLVIWEDMDATQPYATDRDYNDMYLKVSVVPEPVSGVLFLLGSGVMTIAARKKRQASI